MLTTLVIAAVGRRRNIDIVKAHGHIRNHLELRIGIHQGGVHAIGEERDNPDFVLEMLEKHIMCRGQVAFARRGTGALRVPACRWWRSGPMKWEKRSVIWTRY